MNFDLPFDRGQTAQTGLTTIDATVLNNLEGSEFDCQDVDPNTGIVRTGRPIRLRCVRNKSGGALLPKRLVQFSTTAGEYGSWVTGYATVTADVAYPIDEYLPSTGVADNDLFYIVVSGPALVLTPLDAGSDNVINVGDVLNSLTAATSGATTAGRVASADFTGATTPLAKQIKNRIGYALTAKTTANANADLLCDVGKW